jgi:3-isopropylmalate/(R)-2-methylmalate dehydratase small subunit
MEPFKTVSSIAAPLPIKDVDTDMIIPAQFLTSISRDGFGPNLFSRLRAQDAHFFMNTPKYASAEVLVSDSNFGCGSSREHAVWALLGGGIRVVIAKSFADIFSNNSGKNGLLLVTLPTDVVDMLLNESREGTLQLTVDLSSQTVTAADGRVWSFQYDPFLKYCLLHGMDELEYLRSKLDVIQSKKNEQATHWFFSALTPNNISAENESNS